MPSATTKNRLSISLKPQPPSMPRVRDRQKDSNGYVSCGFRPPSAKHEYPYDNYNLNEQPDNKPIRSKEHVHLLIRQDEVQDREQCKNADNDIVGYRCFGAVDLRLVVREAAFDKLHRLMPSGHRIDECQIQIND